MAFWYSPAYAQSPAGGPRIEAGWMIPPGVSAPSSAAGRRHGAALSRGERGALAGALVTKVFHGSGYAELVKLFKETFRIVKPLKPKASRDKSSETFLVGIGLKPGK